MPAHRQCKPWSLILTCSVLWLGAALAQSTLNAPQRVIQQVSDGLMSVLREDRRLLRDDPTYVYRLADTLLLPNLDFDRVCALVLGPYWRKGDRSEQQAFKQAFKTLLIQTYASALDRLSAWEIQYPAMRLEPGATKALVRTEILQPGRSPVQVDYRMRLRGDRWVAYDVLVEGISLLAAYRGQFTTIAQRKGLSGLIADLRTRNASKR